MNEEQLEQAYNLRQQGYSIRDIAAELGVPKSTVDSGLRNYQPSLLGLDEAEAGTIKRGSTGNQTNGESLGLVEARLSHERKMTELSFRQEEIKLQRKELELRELEATNQRELLAIKKKQIEFAETVEDERIGGRKRLYVGKHNRLVKELLDNCGEDDNWSEEEVNDYLERLEALQEKILKFCDYHYLDEESLVIVANLIALIAYVENAKEEKSGIFSSNVCFEADKKQKREIELWLVNDFDDEVVDKGEDLEDSEDEDEHEDED